MSCIFDFITFVHKNNLERLVAAANLLRPVLNELVFLGGAVTGLLITEEGASEPRPTFDVDVIAATKLEAFRGRGQNDFFGSPDLEDIISVIDGRESLAAEISVESNELSIYLRSEVGALLATPGFSRRSPRAFASRFCKSEEDHNFAAASQSNRQWVRPGL